MVIMGIEIIFTWLVDFFDQQFINLILATALLFVIFFVTWWVYRKLSTRNLFSLSVKKSSKGDPVFSDYMWYVTKYFLFFPILTFMGFLIFAFSLFMMIKPVDVLLQANILFIAIVMVCAIRVSSYVSEAMAEDLAKLVPLSLLGILLTQPSTALSGINWLHVQNFIFLIPSVLKYLLFIIILEVLLRGGTWLYSQIKLSESSMKE